MSRQPDLTKSQLFLDDTWVEYQQRLQRLWHKADIFPEPVLRPEKPWEGTDVLLYGTVFKLGETWRMYYSVRKPGESPVMCLAESNDGLQWHRPVLGQVEYEGSKENNIVMRPVDLPTICYDPEDSEAPFKMITHLGKPGGIYGAVSKDGLRWSMLPGPLIAPSTDVQHIMFSKANGKYVVILKTPGGPDRYGTRCVSISESEDFRTFSEPELILRPDLVDSPDIEYHGMASFPYADLYIGLAERWHGAPNFMELLLTWSYDLKEWHRPVSRDAFIGPEYEWNRRWSTGSSAPPIQVGNHLRFYFGGRSGSHYHVKSGPPRYCAVGLATITLDRFVSLSAGFKEGRLVTRPMMWPGGDLLLNASTTRDLDSHPASGGGEMFLEVLDGEGHSIEGFSGSDRAEFVGNVPTRNDLAPAVLRWPGDRSLNELAGRSIKLVFHMRDSYLYSFRSSG